MVEDRDQVNLDMIVQFIAGFIDHATGIIDNELMIEKRTMYSGLARHPASLDSMGSLVPPSSLGPDEIHNRLKSWGMRPLTNIVKGRWSRQCFIYGFTWWKMLIGLKVWRCWMSFILRGLSCT